jgi:hypothetical protein
MKRAAVLAASLVSAASLMAACAGHPSAQDWAGTVCHALGPWRSSINDLNTRAAAEMAKATTPAQAQASLVELVSGAETASETARLAVVAAGVPDVDGGSAVASSFVASLAGTRDAYARAKTDLQALPTGNEDAFYDGVSTVLSRLNDEYQASAVDTTRLDSPELRQAFDGNSACR